MVIKYVHILLLLVLTSLSVFADGSKYDPAGCGDLLFNPKPISETIQDRFNSFDIEYSAVDSFKMVPKGSGDSPPIREYTLPTLIEPSDLWNTEIWQAGEKGYALFDVGFSNLKQGGELQNRIVLGHLTHFPNHALKIVYGHDYKRDEFRLRLFRWGVHRRVLDFYEEEKPYLSADDFWRLYSASAHTSNSEVLALMNYDPQFSWSKVNMKWVDKELLATISITYFGDQDYLRPSLRGVMQAAGFVSNHSRDRFPFEHRLTEPEIAKVRFVLERYFDFATTCEITRYAKFERLPQEVSDRLIFSAFTRAINRGMKTILVSVDMQTLRLFKKYGVKAFYNLPSSVSGEEEFIGFIDLTSEEFQQIYYQLGESAGKVRGMNLIYPQE